MVRFSEIHQFPDFLEPPQQISFSLSPVLNFRNFWLNGKRLFFHLPILSFFDPPTSRPNFRDSEVSTVPQLFRERLSKLSAKLHAITLKVSMG